MVQATSSTVQEIARLMLRHKVGGFPVLDGDRLVGMVTTIDMIGAFLQVMETYEKARSS
jgi:CBS domain-containing protein